MDAVWATLFLGLSLGFGAGISPGPLLTLVVTTTLERGFGAGLRVALAPILTDVPIVALVLLTLNILPPWALTALSVGGGLFVIYLGIETLRSAPTAILSVQTDRPGRQDLLRGALVNLLSPHPWLFWIGVGGPLLLSAWGHSLWHGMAFLLGFYGLLIGSKIALAWAVGRGRTRLTPRWYRRLLYIGGGILIGMGVLLIQSVP
ncbi:MAG: LysE family transporter [Caldilineaceae bacterium]|nr:LysE family transporter [Caldilineaceae bacterium]MBP8108568.1 LysE family transporter [Caldilineaceae bacterium]MBP8124404.1 LysE family transporter [Caldilineaceae bacterium]MBP9071306.1 LysE family transporter [Caldilineaceae bacterium]